MQTFADSSPGLILNFTVVKDFLINKLVHDLQIRPKLALYNILLSTVGFHTTRELLYN